MKNLHTFDGISFLSDMTMLKRFLFCAACIFAGASLYSQEVPVYSVTCPEASGLGEYGKVPVSHFTGIPNISVPLYEIKFGKYVIPVSADYHLASVRPNDPPGSLGLGWTLMAGGVISRSVRGVYDEKCTESGDWNGFYGHTADLKRVSEQGVGSFDTQTRDNLQSETSGGWYELSADEFSFNFLDYSGNFYLNEDGEWTVVSDCDIKVEFNRSTGFASVSDLSGRIPGIAGWLNRKGNAKFFKEFTLVTPDGCRYTFGGIDAMDFSIPYYSRNTDDIVVTSWHLSRVVTPEGYEVIYSYKPAGGTGPVMVDLRYVPGSRMSEKIESGAEYRSGSNNTGRKGFTGFLLYGCDLQSITAPNETIGLFYYASLSYGSSYSRYGGEALYWEGGEARQTGYFPSWPNPSTQFLSLINVSSGATPKETRDNIAGALRCNVLHRIAIDCKGSDGNDQSIYFSQASRGRRKLTGIVWRAGIPPIINKPIISGGIGVPHYIIPENDSGVDMPEYKFSYNPGVFPDGYVFPQTDRWGYYNGHTYSPSSIDIPVTGSNPAAVEYETLTEIQYPTGGISIFEYEGNSYSGKVIDTGMDPVEISGGSGGLRIKSITNKTREGVVTGITRYHYTDTITSTKSSGIAKLEPPFAVTYKVSGPGYTRTLRLSSAKGFPIPVTNLNSPDVGYSSVIEENLDSLGNSAGYIRYIYSNFGKDIYGVSHNDEPAFHAYNCSNSYGVPYSSRSMERGKLLCKRFYTSGGKLVREENIRYKRVCNDSLLTADQRLLNFTVDRDYATANAGWLTRIYTYSYLPCGTETHQYDGDVPYVSEEQVDYNDKRLQSCRTTRTSRHALRRETYSYPFEHPGYSWMSDAHILSPLVSTTVSQGDASRTVSCQYFNAGKSGNVLPYVSKIERSSSEHPEKWTEYEALSVDNYGNPTEIVQGGRHTLLFWDKNGMVLTRRIDNMTRDVLDSLIIFAPHRAAQDIHFPVSREQLAENGALNSAWIYNGNLLPVRTTAPDGVENFYGYDVLNRLNELYYLRQTSHGLLSRKRTVGTFEYCYYDNENAYSGEDIMTPVPGQETTGPAVPDIDSSSFLSLRTGYATTVWLKWFEESVLNRPSRYSCSLKCKDTVTVNFRIPEFSYIKGLGGNLPDRAIPLKLELMRNTARGEELVSDIPFEVDGSTLECRVVPSYGDSVVLRLPPASYSLRYKGLLIDWVPAPDPVVPATSVSESENTSVKVVMECLPLIAEDEPVTKITSWNSVTSFVSRDGSDNRGRYSKIFYDDFGRTYTESMVNASPSGNTLISLQEYDGWGRKSRKWLQGSAPVGSGHVSAVNVKDYILSTYPGETAPYSFDVYEQSPLGRVLESYGPGADWQDNGKAVRYSYLVNNDTEPALACRTINLTWAGGQPVLASAGNFQAGSLTAVLTVDEDGIASYTFTDRLGRTVLTRRDAGEDGGFLDTYYLYDNMDRLIAVLPPALSKLVAKSLVLPQNVLKYAYLYRYDTRGRMCARKIPGKDWIYYVYDSADRPVFEQDGENRKAGKALCHLYDINGRECVKLLCDRSVAAGEEIDKVVSVKYKGASGQFMGYDFSSGTDVAVDGCEILSVNYYDTYSFESDFDTGIPPFELESVNRWPAGQTTGGYTAVLNSGNLTGTGVWSSVGYDSRGRAVHYSSSYPSGETETEDISYDFVGNPLTRRLVHRPSPDGEAVTENIAYSYDSQDRLVNETHSLNGQPAVTLQRNTYDVVGRLSSTEREIRANFTEKRTYNIRSWLRSLSSKLFWEDLNYNTVGIARSVPRYDGLVSSVTWTGPGDRYPRVYNFNYDGLGRLSDARYSTLGLMIFDDFGASYTYDDMGNMLTIDRKCGTDGKISYLDRLTLTYDGTQLVKVKNIALSPYKDAMTFHDGVNLPVEYTYDLNGNMSSDLNRGVSGISYDVNNRPAVVDADSVRMTFDYLASGVKLGQRTETASDTVSMEFRGNLVRRNGKTRYLFVDGGYIDFSGMSPSYMYYFKDHLGNNRVVTTSDGIVAQVNHYYPYGVQFPTIVQGKPSPDIPVIDPGGSGQGDDDTIRDSTGVITPGGGLAPGGGLVKPLQESDQPWKFSGNEQMTAGALSVYDFVARTYDPSLGRFLSIDPMAEEYYGTTPYAYCSGNPVNFVDPEGMDIWEINAAGRILQRIEDDTKDEVRILRSDNSDFTFISFEYGTIEGQTTLSYYDRLEKRTDSYDVFKVRGDDQATELFEFLSTNIPYEYSHAKAGIAGSEGLNFITTGHISDYEPGMTYLLEGQLKNGYSVREINHSHPNNDSTPSGMDPKIGDIPFARYVTGIFGNVLFNIYTPGTNAYHPYDPAMDLNVIQPSIVAATTTPK